MMKMQIKIFIMGLGVALIIGVWGQAVEFLLKSPQTQFDNVYYGYIITGFIVLMFLAIGMIKPPKNPMTSKMPFILFLYAIISACFLLLYNPFFECLKTDGNWIYGKGCSVEIEKKI